MLVQNISNILAHPKLYTPSTLHELHDSTFDVFLSDLQRTHVTGRLSALAVIVVEPGRAHLNNFNSEKLETCHHRCLDHQRFFSLQNWANRWPGLLDPDATDSRDGGIVGSFGAKVHGVTFTPSAGRKVEPECLHHTETHQLLWRKTPLIRVILLFTSFTLELCRYALR